MACLAGYGFSDDKLAISSTILSQVSSVLLIGGLWGGIYELFLRQEFIQATEISTGLILKKLSSIDHEEEVGLIRTHSVTGGYNYRDIVRNSEMLRVVINDGRTWISNNLGHLEYRFKDKTKKTIFIFQHPDSDMVKVLSNKIGMDPASFKNKIKTSLGMLKDISTDDTQLTIYGHKLFNPHTTFLSEQFAVITPYFYSKARKTPPVLCFRKISDDCYYTRLRQDIKALQNDSDDISNAPVKWCVSCIIKQKCRHSILWRRL